MRRGISLLAAAVLALALAACGAKEPPAPSASAPAPSSGAAEPPAAGTAESPSSAAPAEAPSAPPEEPENSSNILVAYFSATGTTRGVAERLAEALDADLYEIVPAEPYSAADLNYNDRSSRSTKEQNDKSARPGIAGELPDLAGVDTIYVGFPIWWGEEPRILDTFVESLDLSGKTLVPFCTSGGSGIGSSGRNMEKLSGGTWLEGRRFSGGVSGEELLSWAQGLQ